MATTTEVRRPRRSLDNSVCYISQFKEGTNGKSAMNLPEFVRAMGFRSEIFARRLFESIDADDSGDITLEEFISGLQKLRATDVSERVRFIFGIFDLDGDGSLSGEELRIILEASMEEEGGVLTEEESSSLVSSLLHLFGADEKSHISYAEFENVITTYPDLLNGLTLGRFGMRTTPPTVRVAKKSFRYARKALSWIVNNPQCLFTYGIVILLLLASFLWKFMDYAGDCDGADMEMEDPVTGYSRQDIMELSKNNGDMDMRSEDMHYMVFSKAMAVADPIECTNARLRKLLGWTLPVAKGCAQAMKVTFTLILLPVSRNLMTTLRDTILRRFFRFDRAIEFHRFLGKVGFLLAWTHTICHIIVAMNLQDPNRYHYWSWAFPEDRTPSDMRGIQRDTDGHPMHDEDGRLMYNNASSEHGMPQMLYNDHPQPTLTDIVTSGVVVTGIFLISIYSFAALFAFDYPKKLSMFKRRENDEAKRWRQWVVAIGHWLNGFNNFWYSHHLFSIFYVVLLLHPMPSLPDGTSDSGGSDSWMWVGIPVLIYVTERIVRVKRSTSNTRVVGADLLDGDVVGLRLLRPRGFRYTPGQYVFIRCPQISLLEWHPFTLTSCPGDSYLGVHVRKAGDWTAALHQLVEEHVQEKKESTSTDDTIVSVGSKHRIKPVLGDEFDVTDRFNFTISVDGPFGAPAQNYSDYKVIVLIGAGIGVTPFASVLTHLLDALKQCSCPRCGYCNPHFMRTRVKKVYFYWTVRSRSEASWFKHLLEAISQRDEDGLLDIQVNITGIKRANDLRTMMLSIAQFESGEPSMSDVHSRTVTRFGRINWNDVFEKVKIDFPSESSVGVFYCGPNTIAKILDKMCRQNSKGPTKFSFMKESFG